MDLHAEVGLNEVSDQTEVLRDGLVLGLEPHCGHVVQELLQLDRVELDPVDDELDAVDGSPAAVGAVSQKKVSLEREQD